ncbi:mitochondrial ribosomal protein S31 isoform X1 [Megalopta genalis]|uniref:mitochondrial ribosomal protein S31 isoform X1 n=3 Tax=Megalopta genalis TaxID=115081 RepID=UPI003FD0785B
MLSVRHILRTQIIIPNKWINIKYNIVRLSSNSSSSDSSDSDSEENTKYQQQTNKRTDNIDAGKKKDIDLYDLIGHLIQKSPSKEMDMKINEKNKERKVEEHMKQAAELLTSSVGGDKEKIVSSLLYSLATVKNKQLIEATESPSFESKNEVDRFKKESKIYSKNKSRTSKFGNYKDKLKTPNQMSLRTPSVIISLKEKSQNEKSPRQRTLKKQNLRKEQQQQEDLQMQQSISKRNEPSIFEELKASQSVIGRMYKSQRISHKKEKLQSLQDYKSATTPSKHQVQEGEKQREQKQSSIIKELLGKRKTQSQFLDTELALLKKENEKLKKYEPSISRSLLIKQFNVELNEDVDKLSSQWRSIKDKIHLEERMTRISSLHCILFDDDMEAIKEWDQNYMSKYNNIFHGINVTSPKTVELDTWSMCEKKYMEELMKKYPENGFQEMIQWTEEGKLWKFPIDNEQGMDEEQNVHFSEHVFLERHLSGWCPTTGPIRHFMELVCVGLSKNPYLKVQEKYDHIMWYKEFFENKNDLLKKLGLTEIAQNKEKQAQLTQ